MRSASGGGAHESAPDGAAEAGGRRAVLRQLRRTAEPLTVAGLASSLTVHPNTVRHHLDSLVADGRVERTDLPTGRRGRPAQGYRLLPMMDPDGPRHDRMLAQILAAQVARHPDPAGEAIAAGYDWGRRLPATPTPDPEQAADGLSDLLSDLGFDPTIDLDERKVELHQCPFLEAAQGEPTVVCSVHLGLIRGVLESREAPFTADRLEPFAEPGLCRIHLQDRPGSS